MKTNTKTAQSAATQTNAAPAPGAFQSRPFAEQPVQPQPAAPDIDTQLTIAQQLGHHFANVSVFPPTPPVIQREAGDESIEDTNQGTEHTTTTGLPTPLKSGLESLSGLSMDNVHVHYNSPQPAQIHAHAYTKGTDIHIGPGQEEHLPHEAWHVVQQKQGRVPPTLQVTGKPVNDAPGLEREADQKGHKAATGPQTTTHPQDVLPAQRAISEVIQPVWIATNQAQAAYEWDSMIHGRQWYRTQDGRFFFMTSQSDSKNPLDEEYQGYNQRAHASEWRLKAYRYRKDIETIAPGTTLLGQDVTLDPPTHMAASSSAKEPSPATWQPPPHPTWQPPPHPSVHGAAEEQFEQSVVPASSGLQDEQKDDPTADLATPQDEQKDDPTADLATPQDEQKDDPTAGLVTVPSAPELKIASLAYLQKRKSPTVSLFSDQQKEALLQDEQIEPYKQQVSEALDFFQTAEGLARLENESQAGKFSMQFKKQIRTELQQQGLKIKMGPVGKIVKFLKERFKEYKEKGFRARFPPDGTIIQNHQIGAYFRRSGRVADQDMTAEKLRQHHHLGALPSYWVVDPQRISKYPFLRPVMLIADMIKHAKKGVVRNKKVYRGDGRGPYRNYVRSSKTWDHKKTPGVLETGYTAWGLNQDLYLHERGTTNLDSDTPDSAFIATSTKFNKALEFALHSPHDEGWVYEIIIRIGLDVRELLGGLSKFPEEQEIIVPYQIPPKDIKRFHDMYHPDGLGWQANPGWKPRRKRNQDNQPQQPAEFPKPGSQFAEFEQFVKLSEKKNVVTKTEKLNKLDLLGKLKQRHQHTSEKAKDVPETKVTENDEVKPLFDPNVTINDRINEYINSNPMDQIIPDIREAYGVDLSKEIAKADAPTENDWRRQAKRRLMQLIQQHGVPQHTNLHYYLHLMGR